MPSRVTTSPEPAADVAALVSEDRAAARLHEVLGLEPLTARHVVRLIASESSMSTDRLGASTVSVTRSPDEADPARASKDARLVWYRAVDAEGAVVYLPTLDVREVALACGGSSVVLPQTTVSARGEVSDDAAWADGLAGYDDVRPLLELATAVLRSVVLAVLVNPLAAAGGQATVRILLLDAHGHEVARGSLLRDVLGGDVVDQADGVLCALGLPRESGWTTADDGATEIYRAARLRPAVV